MRLLHSRFLIVLISFFSVNLTALHGTTLRVATYNIWNPAFEEKYSGKNTWDQRLPFIINNILMSQSDIIGLEEVGKKEYHDLIQNGEISQNYKSYYIPHGQSKPGQEEGRDGLAFFYKPEKVIVLQLVQSSDHSRPTHRRDFYVDLKMNDGGGVPVQFRFACTHLDSDADLSIGNDQLLALVKDVLKTDRAERLDFVVVCGDFNEGENEKERPRYEIMHKNGFFTDGSTQSTRPEALHVRHNGHVDWIYFKRLSSLKFDLVSQPTIGDERASDHKLVMTDVVIK